MFVVRGGGSKYFELNGHPNSLLVGIGLGYGLV